MEKGEAVRTMLIVMMPKPVPGASGTPGLENLPLDLFSRSSYPVTPFSWYQRPYGIGSPSASYPGIGRPSCSQAAMSRRPKASVLVHPQSLAR